MAREEVKRKVGNLWRNKGTCPRQHAKCRAWIFGLLNESHEADSRVWKNKLRWYVVPSLLSHEKDIRMTTTHDGETAPIIAPVSMNKDRSEWSCQCQVEYSS